MPQKKTTFTIETPDPDRFRNLLDALTSWSAQQFAPAPRVMKRGGT